MKKDYRKITLEPGVTLNEMVLHLMEYASRGEFVCVEFEGHKFYSDTISMNSAYQKVYGKSYYEIMGGGQDLSGDVVTEEVAEEATAAVQETAEEAKEEEKDLTWLSLDQPTAETEPAMKEIPAEDFIMETPADLLEDMEPEANAEEEDEEEAEPEEPLSELEQHGRSRIRKPYWAAWKKCVELYEGNAEKEKDLEVCLDIISAIDENDLQLNAAMKVVKSLDLPKGKVNEILDIIETFGDKGYYISKKARASKGFRKTTALGETNCSIYIDRDTRCQYLWVKDGSAGGMHLLVNPDGTPKLYEGDVE